MKVKSIPEDFVVVEIVDIGAESSGRYGLYLLEKKGWNTVDLLRRISAGSGVPYSRFSYGGRKDRHAHTLQYVTVASSRDLTMEAPDYRFRRLGFTGRPMGPDLIRGNRFQVVLRSFDAEEAVRFLKNAAEVERGGFPNYFDDQRFGSMDPERGFIAERILKGQWRGALEIYLTSSRREDPPAVRGLKSRMRETWGDWPAMLDAAREGAQGIQAGHAGHGAELPILRLLAAEPRGYVRALQMIPAEEMSLFFAAYQAYLWNEVLRRLLAGLGVSFTSHPGDAGPYLFFGTLTVSHLEYLRALEMPLPAARAEFPDQTTAALYAQVLDERGIHPGRFNLRKLRQAFFKPTPRKAVVFPSEFAVGQPEPDELNPGRLRLGATFLLPRGSYGTMLIKRLSAQPASIR
ncbi:MAG: tRNA pseudouridine(13) synthase TruD [Firmicutes bacterium]|nr:tRNA pseudouridine(13) synthase TruD [Bacillota bacterium]